jgi:hypothetical protein
VAYSDSLSADISILLIPGIQFVKLAPGESWRQQTKVTSKAAVFILPSHEDKTAALFLPEGAALIFIGEAPKDWDLWSNNALVRLHLVTSRIKEAVEYIILDELSRLEQESSAFTKTGNDYRVDFVNDRSVTLVHSNPPITRVHCVGEKVFPNVLGADRYRSCHFENLCFDLKNKTFVMFPSPLNQRMARSNGLSLDQDNYLLNHSAIAGRQSPTKQIGPGILFGCPSSSQSV